MYAEKLKYFDQMIDITFLEFLVIFSANVTAVAFNCSLMRSLWKKVVTQFQIGDYEVCITQALPFLLHSHDLNSLCVPFWAEALHARVLSVAESFSSYFLPPYSVHMQLGWNQVSE